jgi:hypothetical protein
MEVTEVKLNVETVAAIPGSLPDGRPRVRVSIGTSNAGLVEWLMSPRQAREMARLFQECASECPPASEKRIGGGGRW